MDFTREPIIESIVTPKEGCKLVVRSSKGGSQEEHFVDAVQVVSFGTSCFYRSLERPKAFLVPVSDYEVLEVREARMVLKNVGVERTIKIGGGRESPPRPHREPREAREPAPERAAAAASTDEAGRPAAVGGSPSELRPDARTDKKRERRRQGRRRRGRDDRSTEGSGVVVEGSEETVAVQVAVVGEERRDGVPSGSLTSILPPPSQLISETLQQYRGNELFKDIFSRPVETSEESPVPDFPRSPEPKEEPQQG